MSKFKVGDRVKIVNPKPGLWSWRGYVCVVVEVNDLGVVLAFGGRPGRILAYDMELEIYKTGLDVVLDMING